jgi:hypothetical protein
MRCRESPTEVIAMLDLEANKAIALRLVEVFNGRRLDLLEDVLHPEFRERGLSAFPPVDPEVGPGGITAGWLCLPSRRAISSRSGSSVRR